MSEAKRILVVDDEPNVRLMMRTALESSGYAISEAEDGERALSELRTRAFDMVLLDLRMPLLDGIAALRRIREEGLAVPVVMITAHGSVPDAVEAMKLGAIDLVEKPIAPTALREIVAEVMARHQVSRSEEHVGFIGKEVRFEEVLSRAKRAMNQLRTEEAEAFLRRAIELDESSAEARTLLGVLFASEGRVYAAAEQFRAALKADPDYEAAKHNLQHLEARYSS
jgi:DNA-binding NtrC family response regulator